MCPWKCGRTLNLELLTTLLMTLDWSCSSASCAFHADKAIRRAAALIRALPDTPLTTYWEKTRTMPANTAVERLVKQRIGQDIFRASLEDYWGGCCPITGISERALLRASHTKAWADCESDEERLDVYNGFLLAAHFDAAFDAYLLTFDTGKNPALVPDTIREGQVKIAADGWHCRTR